MRKKNILLFVIISSVLLVACGSENQEQETVFLEENADSVFEIKTQIPVLKSITSVDKSILPALVNLYFFDTSKVKSQVIDKNTLKFFRREGKFFRQAKIHLFEKDDFPKILTISYVEFDSVKFSSYFYFLENQNNAWHNRTVELLPYFAVEVLRMEEGINIKFKPPSKKMKFSAYFFGEAQKAVNMQFTADEIEVEKLFYNSKKEIETKKILKLEYQKTKFSVEKTSQDKCCHLLSNEELNNARYYNNLEVALEDSTSVYVLDLSNKELVSIPPEISELKRLQIFVANGNKLTEIPDFVYKLPNLQVLKFINNEIANLTDSVIYLQKIEDLNLSGNNISEINDSIFSLPILQNLNLSNNKISSFHVENFRCKKLISINLNNNKLTSLPSEISNFQNLIILNISDNPINKMPEEIYGLPNLKILNIKNTFIESSEIEQLIEKMPETEIIF